MKYFSIAALILSAILATGCTRIETGEVGLRINASKEVQGTELLPGSWNQTIVGDVIEFPIRDIAGSLENKAPLTKENVALADFDLIFTYGIQPTSVSEIWTTRPRSLHSIDPKTNDVLLLKLYMEQVVNNSVYKSVREHEALKVNDAREIIESRIKQLVTETLKSDKLDTSITLNLVQVRAIVPPRSILDSAAAVVRSQNDLKVKENEVNIAKKEAERMQALSSNSKSSIEYMDAQARLNISQAALNGKVNTIIMPYDFKGLVSAGK